MGKGEIKLPHNIDDIIADLAVVFHWSPDVCERMSLEDLMMWHDKARERSETKK